MSSATLYRLSGVSLFLGCVLLVIGDLIRVASGTDPGNTLVASGWFLQAIGSMLVALGLPGIYLRQAADTGVPGLVGFIGTSLFFLIFGIFGGLLHGLVLPVLATEAPAVAKNAPAGVGLAFFSAALLVAIGSPSLGVATMRAGVLPRWAGALIIAGGLALFVGHPLPMHIEDAGLVLLLAGLGWLGLSLMSVPGAAGRGGTAKPPRTHLSPELADGLRGGVRAGATSAASRKMSHMNDVRPA